MSNVSIVLPQRLSRKLKEKAEENDLLPEELAVEILFKGLGEESDPEELVEHYRALSEKYLDEAKEFLKKGDLVQASEKMWGATALAIKMVAAKRGLKLEKHGSLWKFIARLSEETEDEELIAFFGEANALHRNFYKNEMDRKAVEVIAGNVEKLIVKLRKMI
jgi:hypothetical protein